jgi:hypothetical protein
MNELEVKIRKIHERYESVLNGLIRERLLILKEFNARLSDIHIKELIRHERASE